MKERNGKNQMSKICEGGGGGRKEELGKGKEEKCHKDKDRQRKGREIKGRKERNG